MHSVLYKLIAIIHLYQLFECKINDFMIRNIYISVGRTFLCIFYSSFENKALLTCVHSHTYEYNAVPLLDNSFFYNGRNK